jgi:hypothetical protein
MRNKEETPVSWLDGMIGKMEQHGADLPALRVHIDKALQLESQKQQKYDEMINVLERASDALYIADSFFRFEIEQLIKEAKEL